MIGMILIYTFTILISLAKFKFSFNVLVKMYTIADIFERILTTVHHHVIDDDIQRYNEDFSKMLSFKDANEFSKFHEVSESIASVFMQKKIGVFVMLYETLAFCIRFHQNYSLKGVNPRMISDAINEMPHSSGEPTFLIGSDNIGAGFGWKQVQSIEAEDEVEIFPLIDFEGICIYYALPQKKKESVFSLGSYRNHFS